MAEINVTDLTTGAVDGNGIFDELMQVTKAHIHEEWGKGRIKGAEYSTVYLGALQAVMDRSLQFLLQQQRTDLEAQLMEAQIVTEGLQQEQITQQTANLVSEKAQIDAQTSLTEQQVANAITENDVMLRQICKLEAEFDVLIEQKLKTVQETSLLSQKKVTEQAQTNGVGVDENSVIGKQKSLYAAQTDGYQRNAEQKAAKLLIDTWNVRRTTDAGTFAGQDPDGGVNNRLGDQDIADVVLALKTGINA